MTKTMIGSFVCPAYDFDCLFNEYCRLTHDPLQCFRKECNKCQVVKVIWRKTASPPRTNRSIVCSLKTFRLNGFKIKRFAPSYSVCHRNASHLTNYTCILQRAKAFHRCIARSTSTRGVSGPPSVPDFLGPPDSHLDRFSRFCRADKRDQQTEGQADGPRYSVCSNRPLRFDLKVLEEFSLKAASHAMPLLRIEW